MKLHKIYPVVYLVLISLWACEPNEKINDELDKMAQTLETRNDLWKGKNIVSASSYTMIAGDYDSCSVADVATNEYFSDKATAESLIPTILNKRIYTKQISEVAITYAVSGEKIATTSSFMYFQYAWYLFPVSKVIETTETPTVLYTLTDADYSIAGVSSRTFDITEGKADAVVSSRISKIAKVLKARFKFKIGDVYQVAYKTYDKADADYPDRLLRITLKISAVK